jgi:hypothetical protein
LSKAVAVLFQAGFDAPYITQIGTDAVNHIERVFIQFKKNGPRPDSSA